MVTKKLAGGFEPIRNGEIFWVIVPCHFQLLKGDVRLARDLLNYIHTQKKEIKEKTNIITLTNLKLLPMQSQGIIM